MKKLLVVLVVLLLVGTFAGTLYFLFKRSQAPPPSFVTRMPLTTTIIKKSVATGAVVPRKEVAIKPRVSGILSELYVEPGRKVEQGELLAKITIVPNLVSLSSAENRVKVSEIALANARRDHARQRQLFTDGVIAESVLQQFELQLENAEQERKAAMDNLELIREGSRQASETSSNTLVRSTVSGMVLEVPVEVGDSVIESNTFNDGTTIASIANMDEMVFEGKVDESEVGKIREGMDLLLTIGAIDQERFDATLEYIAPKGIEENGAIQFEIRAALALTGEHVVRANYSATADIVLDRRDNVLAVEESWLQFDNGKPYVEVETAPQTFERRDIVTGLSDGILIEVVSGLGPDDKIKDATAAGA